MQTAEGLFSDLHGMVFKSVRVGVQRGGGVGGQERSLHSPASARCILIISWGPWAWCWRGMTVPGVDTGSGPWERPRDGRKIEVGNASVYQRYYHEIGQCCKAALSLKIRISAKSQI